MLQGHVGGGEGVQGCYGSITQAGMGHILTVLQQDAVLGTDVLDARSNLWDMGAGLGR
jgi:hypothetical protein